MRIYTPKFIKCMRKMNIGSQNIISEYIHKNPFHKLWTMNIYFSQAFKIPQITVFENISYF